MATPMGMTHSPMNTNMDNITEDDDDDDMQMQMADDTKTATPMSRPSFVNQASLDGDYRPYHDALLTLLSKTQAQPLATPQQRQQTQLQYIHRIMTSAYSRSTLLNDKSKEIATTKLQLDQEGHFWALIAKLLLGTCPNSLLLYQTASAPAIQREIQSFISNLIQQNEQLKLDPAAMMNLIQQGFQEDVKGISIPTICKRRQIILDWIQACHNRSIASLDLSNKENVMWKDTIAKLNRETQSFLSNGDIQEIHPDAPYQGSATLCGKDDANEIHLLENCLSLMKAGRMSEALELCHESGQPWRTAAWDGNAAHGYIIQDKENNGDGVPTRIGNPQRALWKRTMWDVSLSLHSMLEQHSASGSRSGSVVYEAAISAILADDTKTASKNPLLIQNWMDLVWVFYRGLQGRFTELILHAHNQARRNVDTQAIKYPLEGTEWKKEEEEQLNCTAEMSRVEEGAFIARLASQGEWKKGISAFLTGVKDVQGYLQGTIDMLFQVARGEANMSEEEYEPLLRFMLHLVLFFDSFCDLNYSGTDAATMAAFHSAVIAPRRNPLVMVYLQQLMGQKPLWEFTSLYASLLPDDALIDTCTEFWSASVVDERDRRMMLKHAREYFEDGMDIAILRNVVRSSFASEGFEEEALNVASWLGRAGENERCNPELESMLSSDDVRKMHSIRWMCFYNEHYTDALVCANMLLRSLLLELPSSWGERGGDFDDWTDSVKLYTAKVLQSRFLPLDIMQVAMDSAASEDSDSKLDRENVDQHVAEHGALAQFLDAHNAYESWKEFIAEAPPCVPFLRDTRFAESSTESEVAMNMEIIKYVKKKREIAQRLIRVTEVAKDSLMQVLEYANGWLYLDGKEDGNAMDDANDEISQRRKEMKLLRSKYLPAAVSLMYRVYYDTATWMDEFTKDIQDTFERKATEVSSRINGQSNFEANGMVNPFQACTWHRMALLLANTVASSDTKIAECMSKEDLSAFMNCMAETNTCLLVGQEGDHN